MTRFVVEELKAQAVETAAGVGDAEVKSSLWK